MIHHIIYKTTCRITGKFYIGIHTTTDIDDKYIGSGTRLLSSIKKYGRKNHIRKVIETCSNEKELYQKEKEIVNDDLLKNKSCLNLKIGGGISGRKITLEDRQRISKLGGLTSKAEKARKRHHELFNEDAEYKNNWVTLVKPTLLENRKRVQSQKSRNKRKETFKRIGHQKGYSNSNYGKMWITDGEVSRTIGKNNDIPEGFIKGRALNKR